MEKIVACGSQSFPERPNPNPVIIQSFFNVPNLKEIDLSRYKDSKVTEKHFEGLSKLKKIQILDISFNNLDRLPEEIFSLSTLKVLKIDYNSFDKKDITKLKESIPGIQIVD